MAQRKTAAADDDQTLVLVPDSSASRVASAQRVVIGNGMGKGLSLAKPDERQKQGWLYFDVIPEVKQATYFLANTMSLVRLYVAVQSDDMQEPQAPEPGTPGMFEAQEALDRLRGGAGGHGWLVRAGTLNLCVPGEYYLVGYPEQTEILEPDPMTGVKPRPYRAERWAVHSTSELFKDGKEIKVRSSRNDQKGEVIASEEWGPDHDPPNAFVLRVWQSHPEFSGEADSALLGALAECEELVILSRVVRAAGRSRVAGAGILVLPSEASLAGTDPSQTAGQTSQGKKSIAVALMETMMVAITDEGDPKAVVPIVVSGPAQFMTKEHVFWLDMARPFDKVAAALRQELRERLMAGLDIPIEEVQGKAKVNHWTAWQVSQETWSRYGQPKAVVQCEAWTVGYLRPMLEEAGLAPEIVNQWVMWFDPGGAISDPDITASATEAYDRFEISASSYRNAIGFSDTDAPDDAELEERIARAIMLKPGGGGSAASDNGPPNDGTPPTGPAARVRSLFRRRRQSVTASARQPVGVRLAAIDRALRLRLDEAVQSAMFRALERAGARVRNKAAKNATVREVVSRVAAHMVCAQLGEAAVARLDFTNASLLEGGFDGLRSRFDSKVRDAQAKTLAILRDEYDLDDGECAQLQRQQDDDRRAAWLWLDAALVAYGVSKLYNPQPEAVPGEFDVNALVPPSIMREALARAGGADSVASATAAVQGSTPPGGVALGELVRSVWRDHGQVVGGWTWVYGDPSSRGTPFDAHMDLDGVTFATWDDELLAVQPGDDWLGVDFYRPGDHAWCQCDFVAEPASIDEPVPADVGAGE